MNTSVGILGMGMYVPEEVRKNDWWPPEFRERFEQRAKKDVTTPDVFLGQAKTPAQRIQFEQMLESLRDPFRGSRERRVAPPEMRSSEMEIAAARMAVERAGIDPRDIDLILSRPMPADNVSPANAGLIQHALGTKKAHALMVDTACCSFLSGAAIAEAMIKTGQARYALVTTASIYSRMFDRNDPLSVNFGDGAGAAVIGPVESGRGFQAHAFKSMGDLYSGVCIAPKGDGRWYDSEETLLLHSKNLEAGRTIVMSTADFAKEAVETVLRGAGLEKKDVTHFFAHQSVIWFNAACRLGSGLENCQTTDTFSRYASMGAANLPVNLFHAEENGQLKRGDVAVLYACGAGLIWSASVIRW